MERCEELSCWYHSPDNENGCEFKKPPNLCLKYDIKEDKAALSSLSSDRVSAPISCLSCRRCKRDESQNLHCKYRGEFIVMSEDKPCENWLPSKKDLRVWLAR